MSSPSEHFLACSWAVDRYSGNMAGIRPSLARAHFDAFVDLKPLIRIRLGIFASIHDSSKSDCVDCSNLRGSCEFAAIQYCCQTIYLQIRLVRHQSHSLLKLEIVGNRDIE